MEESWPDKAGRFSKPAIKSLHNYTATRSSCHPEFSTHYHPITGIHDVISLMGRSCLHKIPPRAHAYWSIGMKQCLSTEQHTIIIKPLVDSGQILEDWHSCITFSEDTNRPCEASHVLGRRSGYTKACSILSSCICGYRYRYVTMRHTHLKRDTIKHTVFDKNSSQNHPSIHKTQHYVYQNSRRDSDTPATERRSICD